MKKTKQENRNNRNLETGFKCKKCNFSANNIAEVSKHAQKNHKEDYARQTSKNYFECSICEFATQIYHRLRQHYKIYHRKEETNKKRWENGSSARTAIIQQNE